MNIRKILADRNVDGAVIALSQAVALFLATIDKDIDDHGELIDITPLAPELDPKGLSRIPDMSSRPDPFGTVVQPASPPSTHEELPLVPPAEEVHRG